MRSHAPSPEDDAAEESETERTASIHIKDEQLTGGGGGRSDADAEYETVEDEDDEEEEWDKSTAEIMSISSDELHETRPNRWTGPPATWRNWTQEDRNAWISIEGARSQDLGVHLYNAFALKKAAAAIDGGDIQHGNDDGGGRRWAPPKVWTAWPLSEDDVPDDWLLPRTVDMLEEDTVRRRDWKDLLPGTGLEEEISAAVMKFAKERFMRRDFSAARKKETIKHSVEIESGSLRRPGSVSDGQSDDSGGEETDRGRTPGRESRKRRRSPSYFPILSADDAGMYRMVRPATRRIMEQLDETLRVLHNSRIAALRNFSTYESASEEEEEEEAAATDKEPDEVGDAVGSSTTHLKRRGRPRHASPRYYESERSLQTSRGRPRRVHVPREGETEEEMLIRVRRQSKRRNPIYDSDAADGELSCSRSVSRTKRKPVARVGQSVSRSFGESRSRSRSAISPATLEDYRNDHMYSLRDWRDVLGAAALAGFASGVVARATQRCATLFREDMTMNTLREVPIKDELMAGLETKRYIPDVVPEDVMFSDEDVDDDMDEKTELKLTLQQRRATSRQPSIVVRPAEPQSSPVMKREASGSESEKKRRQRSATPGGVKNIFCPHADCRMAVTSFARHYNLRRHLEKQHGEVMTPRARGRSRSVMTTDNEWEDEDEEDSVGEMDGAVHVDGFLRPIQIQRGWTNISKGTDRGGRYRVKGFVKDSEDEDDSNNSDAGEHQKLELSD
ncbi:hypothetical protein B0H66DRAFT_13850 [Apodospora peruviana]|uniref:Rrn9 domain-containing protein n=1 Tax=Apodospora peruviana TaxID=516989 RepID=A0AAE0IQJ2_9PEZI|nr:hypothetical protein B0H66DRAFT_13850 [Apodospora peruviana]